MRIYDEMIEMNSVMLKKLKIWYLPLIVLLLLCSTQGWAEENKETAASAESASPAAKESPMTKEERELADFQRAVKRYIEEASLYRDGLRRMAMSEYAKKLTTLNDSYGTKIQELREEEGVLRHEVIQRMEAFLERYGTKNEKSAEVLFRLAKLHYEKSDEEFLLADLDNAADYPDFTKTLGYIDTLKTNFPTYEMLDAAFYLEGFCLLQIGEDEKAKDVFLALANRFPESTKRAEALTRIGEYYFARSQEAIQGFGAGVAWDKALYYYGEAVKEGKDTQIYDRALYRKAWTEYYTEDYDSMIKDFIALVDFADESSRGSALRSEAVEFMAVALAEEVWDLSSGNSIDPDFGMERFDKYLHEGKDFEVEVLRAYADTLVEQMRYDYAAEAYEAYLERNVCDPENPKLAKLYISTLNMSGQRDKSALVQSQMEETFGEKSEWFRCQQENGNLEALAYADSTISLALKDSIAAYHQKMEEARAMYVASLEEAEDTSLKAEDRRMALVDAEIAEKVFMESNTKIIGLITDYLQRYPNDDELYTYQYLLAESYFNVSQYANAAVWYEKVRDIGEGRYRRSAAIGAIEAHTLSLSELLFDDSYNALGLRSQEIREAVTRGLLPLPDTPNYILRELRAEGVVDGDEIERTIEARNENVAPVAFTKTVKSLVDSRDIYLELGLDRERRNEDQSLDFIYKYQNALVFFNHQQYEEAEKRFNVIIDEHSDTNEAMLSAQYVLSMYNDRGELDKVAELSDMYAAKNLGADGGQAVDDIFKSVKYVALFDKAYLLFQEEKYLDSAVEYERIVDENPSFENIHLALYYAGMAYEKIKYYDSAMRLYKRLYTEYPKVDEAVDALFRAGQNAEKFFQFTQAYNNYMELYNNKQKPYQNYEHRAVALRQAALIKKIMHETREAAKLFERYHKEQVSMPDAGTMLFEAAMAYKDMNNYNEMERVLREFRSKYGSDIIYRDRVLESYIMQADMQLEQKKNANQAKRFYNEAIDLFQRTSTAGGVGSYLAAKAQFMLAEIEFDEWAKIQFSGKPAAFDANMKKKHAMMGDLIEMYGYVGAYGNPEWNMAYEYAIGKVFHKMADDLDNAPCPTGVYSDTCDAIKTSLVEVSLSMKENGMAKYQAVIAFSNQVKMSNQWSRLSTQGMSRLSPNEYPLEVMADWEPVYNASPLIDPLYKEPLLVDNPDANTQQEEMRVE